jgi:TolB-like protein/Tfp pilus assembly protein PilF
MNPSEENSGTADGDANKPISDEPDSRQVLDALQKIITQASTDATERSRRLLEYLVTEELEGRGSRIKAYSIATEVLGRPSSFDPQKDPIVRIEAARLRRMLEHYYLTEGRDDAVIIEIPKGAYVPRFRFSGADGGAQAPASRDTPEAPPGRLVPTLLGVGFGIAALVLALVWIGAVLLRPPEEATAELRVPALIVKPLTDLAHSTESALIAQGLTERIIEKTSRFQELSVIATDADYSRIPASEARYEFGGTLRMEGGRLLVQTRLVDRTDGRVIWADSIDAELKPRQIFNVELQIADQIATRIAEPTGVVFQSERRMLLDTPPESWSAYYCVLTAYAYRASVAAAQHEPVRACLERAVAAHQDYATAWALLSLVYLDEVRFLYPPPPGNAVPPLTRAYDTARRAVELDAANIRGQQALMMALALRGENAAAIEVGTQALALNPNDVDFKGEFGHRVALNGEWDRGCTLVEEALKASAQKTAYYKSINALCHYFSKDVKQAAIAIRDADAIDNPAYHVIAAAILAEAGDTEQALEHVDWLRKAVPGQLDRFILSVTRRLARPEDRERFLASLRKVGLDAGS